MDKVNPDGNKVLVIGRNDHIRQLIKFNLESSFLFEIFEYKNPGETLNLMSDPNVVAVIYDFHHDDYFLNDLISYFEGNQDIRPLVIFGPAELKNNYKILSKSILFLERTDCLKGLQGIFYTFFDAQKEHAPEDFCRVALKTMEIFDGLSNDLYLQLSSGRFVKLFKQGDELVNEDINKYAGKGVEYFYIKQKTSRWVLKQVDSQIRLFLKNKNYKFILRSPDLSPEKQFEQKLIRLNDELLITEEFKNEIEEKAANAIKMLKENPRFKNPLKYIKLNEPVTDYLNSHIRLLLFASAGLAKKLGWHSDVTLEKLVYASLIHDMPLAAHPRLIPIRDRQTMEEMNLNEKEKELVFNHPQLASQLIKSSFQNAPTDTDILVLQHHELPDGGGFPLAIKSGRIVPLSTLFIIAHEMVDYIIENDKLNVDDFLFHAEKKFSSISFNKILTVIKKNITKDME